MPIAAPSRIPLAPGWVLLDTARQSLWHYRIETGFIACRPHQYAFDPHEWRPEPRGRNEACPSCRRKFEASLRQKDEPQPQLVAKEPEVLNLEPMNSTTTTEVNVQMSEPKPAPIEGPKPLAKPKIVKPKSVASGLPANFGLPSITGMPEFCEHYGFDITKIYNFVYGQKLKVPKLPGSRAMVLDRKWQEKLAREYRAYRDGIETPKRKGNAGAAQPASNDEVMAKLAALAQQNATILKLVRVLVEELKPTAKA